MDTKPGVNTIRFFSLRPLLYVILFFCFVIPARPEIKKNEKAPQINLRDMDNRLVFVSNELKDKPVLVNFFFTACAPCRRELPELEILYNRYKQKAGMYLISTDSEGSDAVRPYLNKLKITIPVLIDKYSDVAKIYGIDKYPSMILIGKNGKVIFVTNGYNEENIAKLEDILKKLK
jgi:peroxiredoxin